MDRFNGVEWHREIPGVFDIDHQLMPAARRDLAHGSEFLATVGYERLETDFDVLVHDPLLAMLK
jgi:hypothetical protein